MKNVKYSPLPIQEPRDTENKDVSNALSWSRYRGLLYSVLTALLGVLVNSLIKSMRHYTTAEMNLYQTIWEVCLLLPLLIKDGTKFVFFKFWVLLVLRSVIVSARHYFRILATIKLPVAEANALHMGNPIFVAITARIFLKDRFNNAIYLSLGVIFLGMNMISRFWSLSTEDGERALGLGSVFLAAIVHAFGEVVVKKITNGQLPAKLIVFYVSCLRFVYLVVITESENGLMVPRIPICSYGNLLTSESVRLALIGIVGLINQVLVVEAIRLENPSAISAVITTVSLPSYLISQYVVFNDVPTPLTIAGTFLILLGSLIMNFAKIIEKMPDSSRLKNMFKILNE